VKRYLADTNVGLDLATLDPVWYGWSLEQVAIAATDGEVLIDPIIYAEMAPSFVTEAELEQWYSDSPFNYVDLPRSAAWPAAQAFKQYRKAGGPRTSLLPDFYIGAHAQVEGLTLITRDPKRFQTYFPDVPLITPRQAGYGRQAS
jgi:predicted nucleic acid-binding protein